jgi:imidazoleglycerol phosphate synthase glutamine amidotransferase subunit HisH
MTVAIIDHGSGNLRSAAKALERAAGEAGLDRRILVTADPAQVRRAGHVVLPGVGAFGDCRQGLDALPGMVEALEQDTATTRAWTGFQAKLWPWTRPPPRASKPSRCPTWAGITSM